jgi:hypothetical protein
VEVKALYGLFNLPHINQVYLLFRGRLLDLDFSPGLESLEVRLFEEAEIPWQQIAFPIVKETLALYFRDRANGGFSLHSGDVVRSGSDMRRYEITIHG